MKKRILCVLLALLAIGLFGCGNAEADGGYHGSGDVGNGIYCSEIEIGDRFSEIGERGYTSTQQETASAFSLNCSDAAYVYMRRSVTDGRLPDKNSVRAEEYINYFDYDVPVQEDEDLAVYTNVYACPYNDGAMLLRITAAAKEVEKSQTPNNLVFLVDTSASMYGADRLGLFVTAINYVAKAMKDTDTISVITYGGSEKILLDGVTGARRDEITEATQNLTASGVTAGASAIATAYDTALKHYIHGGNNLIILFTDGDFNVGTSSAEGLKKLVEQYSHSNIALSCVGVGYGNYTDTTLQAIAEAGNGSVYYADGEAEIKRIFGEDLSGVLYTVAADAKASVTFNANAVDSFRLIGYDNRSLTAAQFEDDGTNAGEIGSGTQVTAVYEIIPADTYDANADNVASVTIKYKRPQSETELELTQTVRAINANADDEFIACVTEYALLLRRSEYAANANIDSVIDRLQKSALTDERKVEFSALCERARALL